MVNRTVSPLLSKDCTRNGHLLIAFQPIDFLTRNLWRGFSLLEPMDIHLWGIELNGSSDCRELCLPWLDEVEQQRAGRLVREEDRKDFVFAHGGLRAILSGYLGVSPDKVEMCRSVAGKPFLAEGRGGQSAITFNLSHAHGRALIAVSHGQEVGVDLERVRSDLEFTRLSERYFSPSEHSMIMQSSQENRAAQFFRYWVSKEAVVKAQGVGLQALSQCEILLGADGVCSEIRVPAGSQLRDDWSLRHLSCGKGWAAAVAAQGKGWVVRCGAVRLG